jgi:hypothetical protein
MGAAQQLTLNVLKAQCQAQEERYPGYRVDVANRLRAILKLVRLTSNAQVRDKVSEELQDFGETLGRKTATANRQDDAKEVQS